MALIKCPECEREISDSAKRCIHCGYTLPKKSPKKMLSSKQLCLGVLGIVLIIALATVFSFGKTDNPYKQYTDLIGKHCDQLSDDFVLQQNALVGDFWTATKRLDVLDFPNVSGTLTYHYTATGWEDYSTAPYEIHKMEWQPAYVNITDSMVQETVEHLSSIYGECARTKEFDNNSDKYFYKGSDFSATDHVWECNDFTVYLTVEYHKSTPVSIIITWWNK